MSKLRFPRVLSPVVTPFDGKNRPDIDRWLDHCRRLIGEGCGLAVFGTNSEANSLGLAERIDLLDALAGSDVGTAAAMPGIGACAVPDAVALGRKAVEVGAPGVLCLPPFYYKGVSEDGLYAYFAEVIAGIGDAGLKLYLYHIPQVSQVPVTLDLIARLKRDFAGTVAGVKDSSGDWENTSAMIGRFDDFDVYAGTEELLLRTRRAGGVGCISATANINAAAIAALAGNADAADAEERQRALTAFRKTVAARPMIPALKAVIAARLDDPAWCGVRPPLTALSIEEGREILRETEAFTQAA